MAKESRKTKKSSKKSRKKKKKAKQKSSRKSRKKEKSSKNSKSKSRSHNSSSSRSEKSEWSSQNTRKQKKPPMKSNEKSPSKNPRPERPYKSQRKIINPCFWCCCKPCNLRMNCFVISFVLIFIGLLWICNSAVYIPRRCDDSPKYKDVCDMYEADGKSKSVIGFFRVVFIASFVIGTVCCMASAVALLFAVFMQLALVALIASMILVFTILPVFLYHVAFISYVDNWPHLITHDWDFETQKDMDYWQGWTFAGGILNVLWLPLMLLYFAFCAFQLHKQIKAKIDKKSHRAPCKNNG